MNQLPVTGFRRTSLRRTLTLFVALLITMTGMLRFMSQFSSALPNFVPELLGAGLLTVVGLFLLRRVNGRPQMAGQPVGEQIIGQVTEGILTISQHGRLVAMNPAAEKLFGYRFHEIQNEPITNLLTEPPSENQKLFHDTISIGTVLGLAAGAREMVGRRKNGELFPLELVLSSMTLGDDQVTVAFARDVSKRKQAQRYLTAHYAATCILAEASSLDEALPQILQSLSDSLQWDAGAYWSLDQSTNELCCAATYQAPFAAMGSTLDAKSMNCQLEQGLIGRTWSTRRTQWSEDILNPRNETCPGLDAAHQIHGAFAIPILRGARICGVLALFSSRTMRSDPWLSDILGEFGKQMGHFIARKRNEKKLIRSEERFRQLAENIHEVFWMVDAHDDRTIYVSPSCEEVWGQVPMHLKESSTIFDLDQQSQSLFDFVHPEDRPIYLSAMERQKRGEKTSDEYRIVRPDGKIRSVWSRAFPVLDDSNSVYRIVGITADITEQKQLEERLRQGQKMEAVGQLAGGVAHDFNNLLSVIIGYSEILLGQTQPGEQSHELIEQIQKAADRAAALTRQLLAFGRKQKLQAKALNVNDVVQDMTKMLSRMIGEDIEMVIHADPQLGQVQADPTQIEQILMNLASNARDAMPQGGTLTFTTQNIELNHSLPRPDADIVPGSYVLLTVTDTGEGMDATTSLHAFEPFFTTKDIGKGTGLGLATVYGIVKQSHGHIELDSQLNHGTTFRIYLPRQMTETVRAPEPQRPSNLQRGKETVLLVEDEDIVRRLTSHVLQASGYTVLSASSGEEALTLCREHQGDIALLATDILMPQMNGVRLAELALQVRKNLKVLFISGYTNNILENYGHFDASAAFLSKPASPKVLAAKVREVLDTPAGKAVC